MWRPQHKAKLGNDFMLYTTARWVADHLVRCFRVALLQGLGPNPRSYNPKPQNPGPCPLWPIELPPVRASSIGTLTAGWQGKVGCASEVTASQLAMHAQGAWLRYVGTPPVPETPQASLAAGSSAAGSAFWAGYLRLAVWLCLAGVSQGLPGSLY